MINNSLNKDWKINFFKIFSTDYDVQSQLKIADKIKFEHFPPVLGNFFDKTIDLDELKSLCNGKIIVKKSKLLPDYNDDIISVDYKKVLKNQLNLLMKQQMDKLYQEDPNFLSDDEKEIIEKSEFPFIKLMTLVYSKDTDKMTKSDQEAWKNQMGNFINEQIIFHVINTYYTMLLYQDNNYVHLLQTPYNKKYLWDNYADNKKGFCVVYDFKEITDLTAKLINQIYPVLYVKERLFMSDIDYPVYNTFCSSLTMVKDNVDEYENHWAYIFNHHFTESEYKLLDNLLEPVYNKTTNYDKIQFILKDNYFVIDNEELNYDYDKIIEDILDVLSSDDFKETITNDLNNVFSITDDEIEIEFIKPEAIYLGTNFSKDLVEEYKKVSEENGVKIFLIKESEGKLFKSLI